MRRIAHGSTSPPQSTAHDGADADFEAVASDQPVGIPFGHLFPDLATDDEALLPRLPATLDNLTRLGDAMRETTQSDGKFSNITSAYTYFGQFLDHDITFTKVPRTPPDLTDSCMLGDPQLAPWDVEVIKRCVKNKRASLLELDSVYSGKPPKDGDKLFKLDRVTHVGGGLPAYRDEFQDVPRGKPHSDAAEDRVAQIGDPRNDQNVLISQLHVAFLRAHNAIVRLKQCSFDEAREALRQHYHWIIVHDYLKRVTADDTVEAVLADPAPLYRPEEGEFFLPLEFTVAAFRFGHSMIRSYYHLNGNYSFRDLRELFTLRALGQHPTLPEKAVIEWEKFLPGYFNPNAARRLDTHLVNPLRRVLDEKEQPVPCETRLAVLDLKRGYMMRIPTGQAVARKLGLHVMEAEEIEAAVPDEVQRRVLREAGFLERTPLWFYILAEAANDKVGGGGQHLGPVGSRLVAEVLIGLVRRSRPSILDKTGTPWSPWLPRKAAEHFDLADLLRLAGVLYY